MSVRLDLPLGFTERNDRIYNECDQWVEKFEGKWVVVLDGSRHGWWRYHEHYDRNGYCDSPARGY